MPDGEHCGAAGPGELTCTRVSDHEGSHTAYPDVDGDTLHVEWFRCNPIGEPVEDSPPPEDFDYGERQADGQFENYPTIKQGEFVQEVRKTYVHEECGTSTSMSKDLAESVARDPDYYGRTFCAGCEEHVPVDEVHWKEDGEPWVIADA